MKPGLAIWEKLLHDSEKQSLSYLKIYKPAQEELAQKQKKLQREANLAVVLRHLQIRKPTREELAQKQKKPQREAFLAIVHHAPGPTTSRPTYEDCEFPENDMPENIKMFKHLEIGHFDDEASAFLNKIKSLFNNVNIDIRMREEEEMENLRILFRHFLPMLGTIRAIHCNNDCMEWLEREFPGALARAKELVLSGSDPDSIPAYLKWLNAPRQNVDEPKFLIIQLRPGAEKTFVADMVGAVRKNFLAATCPASSATFAILIHPALLEPEEPKFPRAEESNIENAATNERLTIRNVELGQNAYYKTFIHSYVEILRHRTRTSTGAYLRDWLKEQDFWEKRYTLFDREKQVISIDGPSLTIGQITDKNTDGVVQAGSGSVANAEAEAGPSNSAK